MGKALPLLPNISSFVIITGPTRGFGKCITLELAKFLKSPSIFVLIGRSQESLAEVAEEVKTANRDHIVEKFILEFGSISFQEKLRGLIELCCSLENISTQTILIHNHGSFMSQYSLDLTSAAENSQNLSQYLSVNLTQVAQFNGALIKALEEKWFSLGVHFYVINISSLAASRPFPSWAPYCIAKAARVMLFSCLAIERPTLNILQYSPGPLKTEMSNEVQQLTKDDELREQSKTWDLVDPEVSASKLMAILSAGNFEVGQCIDYFDEI